MAHLLCAQEACLGLGLDHVLLMPVASAPHRTVDLDPGAEARAAMCELASAHDTRIGVTRIELERDGPSYTADTLAILAERSPQTELTLILGADQAAALPDWERPGEVLEHARLAVAERDGLEQEVVLRRIGTLGHGHEIDFFAMPRIDVSSSLVRQRVASGRPIRYLVDEKVRDYIDEHDLYREARPR